MRIIEATVRSSVMPVWERIGTTADISHVLLIGGGAALFRASVKAHLKNQQVELADDPANAVVCGLQFLSQLSG
jgi:hypothetical protein